MGGLSHHIPAGNNAGNNAAALKHPGARGSGVMGDASTAGEAISSAIVKYNYQAQQVMINPIFKFEKFFYIFHSVKINTNPYFLSRAFITAIISNDIISWTS